MKKFVCFLTVLIMAFSTATFAIGCKQETPPSVPPPDAEQPDNTENPGDTENPGGTEEPSEPENPDGTEKPDPPEKPEEPEKPSVSDIAKKIVDSLLQSPDPWDFMPIGLQPETLAYSSAPQADFTDFVNVSAIGKKPIGRQLNVLYDGLQDATTLLGYIDKVYAVGTTVASLYQDFINKNPDNYAQFSGKAGGFEILIKLDGENSLLLAGNPTVSVELYNYGETGKRAGRVQITNGMALKYESTGNSLKFAVKKTVNGIGSAQQIEFVREQNAVAGVMYEYMGTENKSFIKTTATITFNEDIAYIVSDKRETDDLKINGYEEVYNAKTGDFIGGEVAETVKSIDFDTFWFMLGDIDRINSVKVSPEMNGDNADTIYLNNQASPMHTKLAGITSGLKAASRRFDVEMRNVWYLTKSVENGKVTYLKTKAEIPMLFVQKDFVETFGEDMQKANNIPKENLETFPDAAPSLPNLKLSQTAAKFPAMQQTFLELKELGSREAIEQYIGEKSPLFQN